VSWDVEGLAQLLGYVIVLSPLAALLATSAIAVFGAPVDERGTNRWTQASITAALLGGVGMLALMLASGERSIAVDLGNWVVVPGHRFRLAFGFLFDRLSTAFLLLVLVLSAVVSAFARVYLHREPGYRRFYLLFALFVLGMSLSSIAGTIETLFAGWELVGLSSALLVGFFQERPSAVRNGLIVWTAYRIADAAFLASALALHHIAAEGDFARMTGSSVWPHGAAAVGASEAFAVGSLLLLAAAGKSGLVPFSGWLPRAMEGPTPSSAIFYGALSVHLGAFLLLRMGPLLSQSAPLGAVVVSVGLVTALWATLAARVQADIKAVLAYASLTQVGLIVAEIGLGLRYVPLVHILGNASLRTLQLLRAPSLLRDYHEMENAIGAHLQQHSRERWLVRLPEGLATALYRVGYERSLFDLLLVRLLLKPALRLLRALERLELRWIRWLSGTRVDRLHERPAQGDPFDPLR